MLKKLYRYDMIFYLKTLVPILILNCVIILLNILTKSNQIVFNIVTTIQVLFIAILFAGGIFLIIYNFYTSIYSKQGYLTNTLPVKPQTIVMSKLISMLTFLTITVLICFINSIYFLNDKDFISLSDNNMLINLSLLYFALLLQWCAICIVSFTAISYGFSKTNHKILFSISYLFIIVVIQEIVSIVTTTIYGQKVINLEINGVLDFIVFHKTFFIMYTILNLIILALYINRIKYNIDKRLELN